MALYKWPVFKPPLQNFNPTFSNPNMANYNQLTNANPTTGAQYQVTQVLHPSNQARMINAPRPVITHHVMVVSTLTRYPTQLPSPTIITQPYPKVQTYTPPRAPFYHQPPGPTNNSTCKNVPSIQQQQQTAQSPNRLISMASPRTIKRALRRKKQRLKHQQLIMNNKIANQSLKVAIENQLQQQEIIVMDKNAPESAVIDDQTDDQSSAQM